MTNGNGIDWEWLGGILSAIVLGIAGFFGKDISKRVRALELKQAEHNKDIDYIKTGIDDIRDDLKDLLKEVRDGK